jgi:hypothetical protein
MDWEKYVVQINVKSKDINLNYPLNIFKTSNSSGTGFFISSTEILTCYHVVSGAINIDITFKHTNSMNGRIKHIFPDDDLAIIEIDPHKYDIKILDHETIKSTESFDVFTVGFPLSSTNIKITKGIISGYQDSLIQTDASLNHGNSGGPLILFDAKTNTYKVIGVNVSKLKGDAEKTGYVVPIYRFNILRNKLDIKSELIIRKPLLYFDFQPLTQDNLISTLLKSTKNNNSLIKEELKTSIVSESFYKSDSTESSSTFTTTYSYNNNIVIKSNNKPLKKNKFVDKVGVRITSTNKNYYHSNHIKINDILLKVNGNIIDRNGFIKFDFYPEKIPIDDIGLWFTIGDNIEFEIFDMEAKSIKNIKFILEYPKSNLFDFYNLDDKYKKQYPNYFVEKNGLILSIISNIHLENLRTLKLSMTKIVKIFERRLYHKDLFTIYLADTKYTDIDNNIKYPVGEIIIKINNTTFESYNELINIINNDNITSIETIDNNIYIIASK